MIKYILVPLDGSALAECVLPHVCAIAQAFNARITLLHIVVVPHEESKLAIDPLEWLLRKREAKSYLDKISARLQENQLKVNAVILDGSATQGVIDFAQSHDVDLIALSTHGQSGLSRWNINSVAQKIVLGSFKSILLVRAYQAEYILPVAIGLARYFNARLVLGTVIQKPELVEHILLSDADVELAHRIADRNYGMACHYLEQLYSQFSHLGIDLQSRLIVSDNITVSLHDMVQQEDSDLLCW